MLRVFAAVALVLVQAGISGCGSEAAKPDAAPSKPDAAPSLPGDWDHDIQLPEARDESADPAVVELSLVAKPERVLLDGEREVELWTYNGVSPGPLIRVPLGARLRVHFKNELPEPTTIHWHGLEVPAAMDGADPEHSAVAPGETFEYEFVPPHAGTYWYHPHMNSAEQVWRGLYGALIVEDPEEPELGLEAVIVMHDISFEGDRPTENHDSLHAFFGRQGEHLLVNGRVLPSLRVPAGTALRLRLINAAVSRYYRLGLAGHTLTRVAGDSGFLEAPEASDDVLLVPGERAEVVVVPQGEPDTRLTVEALPYERFACEGCEKAEPLLHIDIVPGQGEAPEIPARLASIPAIGLTGARERSLVFMESQRGTDVALGLNGQLYPEDPLEFHAKVGDTEIWTLENDTDYDHPFHLHGFRFQVLSLEGSGRLLDEWKDTLNLPARGRLRVAMRFDDRPGMWMLHCHILDHAELGMMGMLHVSP